MSEKVSNWLGIIAVIAVVIGIFLFLRNIIHGRSQDVNIPSQDNREVEMVTRLARDAIPAIDNPEFYSIERANQDYRDNELVIGVEINGDARAYSVPHLSSHEIVNDTVGNVPIAVTW